MPINSRAKGQAAERAVASILADLLGITVSRRIQNFKGDYDLIGLERFGFAGEVKHYAAVTESLKAGWWAQACEQARLHKLRPVLFYRGNRQAWRAVVPASVFVEGAETWEGIQWTMEMSLEMFAAVARDSVPAPKSLPLSACISGSTPPGSTSADGLRHGAALAGSAAT